MSQRIRGKVKKRRGFIYLWILGLILVVSVLIYFEQTAMLYVFSTLGVTALLVIVAIADLGENEHGSAETAPAAPAVVGKK
ncbi:MAG: hypothetical protein ACXW3C_04870 [Pyrinomonadaceae bacterium]